MLWYVDVANSFLCSIVFLYAFRVKKNKLIMDHPLFMVKCIFCGLCVNENALNDHMKVFHKIRTFLLKPQLREASTQIVEEDRHFIYPGKRKLVDIKYMTSTPKKSNFENSVTSLTNFIVQDTTVDILPKLEPRTGCHENSNNINNMNQDKRFQCPYCDHHHTSCENVTVHIQAVHIGDQEMRPVSQQMRLVLRKTNVARGKLNTHMNYYKQYGGLYLHSGVKGNYQCVLKSGHNIRDIRKIKSGCNRNNIPIQDYSIYSFESLKDLIVNTENSIELDDNTAKSHSGNKVKIFVL